MEHLTDDRQMWCGNIPSRISAGELKTIMQETLGVDVTVMAKGQICRRRQWAILLFDSASGAQAFRADYDGKSIQELHVPGNPFQVAPLKQKIVRRPVLIPPVINRPYPQRCISAAALLHLAAPEAIGCPRFRGTVLAASLPPGHPQSPARKRPKLDEPKLDEPKLQEYLVPVANPAEPAVETKHEKDHNSPAAGLREAGIKTESEEVDTKFEAEDTVAPDEYEVHTEIDEESTEDSPATEFDEMNETNHLRAVLYDCMRQDRTLLACNVSQGSQPAFKTESRDEIDTEFEAEDAVAPEKTKYKYEPKTEVDEMPVSRKKRKKKNEKR